LLSNYNEKIRDEKKIINKECIIRKRDTLLHVCLNSPGCRFRKYGSCTMCNYGQGRMISFDEIEKILQDRWEEIRGFRRNREDFGRHIHRNKRDGQYLTWNTWQYL